MLRAMRVAVCCVVLALAACGETSGPPASSTPATPLVPADAQLAKLYAQTCRACHATGAGGAPISGDRAAWAPRAAQGLPVLMQHTVAGYKAMPPLGLCSDCSEAEFEALIKFMAGM